MNSIQKPKILNKKNIPGIWYIPLVALLVGLWMTYQHYSSLGPEVHIEFKSADGLEPGKTKIKSLSVDIGTVDSITINDDLKSVSVIAQLNKEAAPLLREDSQFWIVRPRVSAGGISGLGTLLSGAYIELTPGSKDVVHGRKHKFMGLDQIPKTPANAPGLHFMLTSEESVSVSSGDPIYFRGFEVGRVESVELDTETKNMLIDCYIKPPFNNLVTTNTRFWNASGISFKASAAGFKLSTESISSILRGGIAFDLPKDVKPGDEVQNHTNFKLYRDRDSINEITYKYYEDFKLFVETSVAGLEAGSPVTYRGIRIGTVHRVSFENQAEVDASRGGEVDIRIPVIVRIEPGRWAGDDTKEALQIMNSTVETRIKEGLRATIKLANLVTGARLIAIDYFANAKPVSIEWSEGMLVIPTVPGDVEDIGKKIAEIVNKLNKIKFEKISADVDVMVNKISETAESANTAVNELNKILANENTQQIPGSINENLEELKGVLEGFSPDSEIYRELGNSIEELNSTLRNIESITHTIDTKTNSIIFSKPKPQDIQPEVPQ